MGHLSVIRHGQASFMAADYDQLSPLGYDQMRALGREWARRGRTVDALFVGPLKRQRQSAASFIEGFGVALPETPVAGLDEYPAFQVMAAVVPTLARAEPAIAELVGRLGAKDGSASDARERLFRAVTSRWVRGELDAPGVPEFAAFRRRVEAGLQEILAATASGGRVMAVTSGGVVGALVGHALSLDNSAVLETSWIVRNASVNEFLFDPSTGRFSLHIFNATPHLDADELLTYR